MPPCGIQEVEILDGVLEAVELLTNSGFIVVVVTNQPDVARGKTTKLQVEEINSHIGRLVGIKYFYTCFHDDAARCRCRKPGPGLIEQAGLELNLNLESSYLVGDRWRDVSAGQTAGCETFFIDYSYPEKQPRKPFTRVSSLLEAASLLVRGK
jgi:D-glycero-D-manno-heptose 1,7-bisphosphate phosphatase